MRWIFVVAAAALVCPLFVATLAAQARPASEPKKIIIDTDPGTDDAIALLLAFHSPEVKVEAVTIVAGNVTSDMGLDNALKIASLAGRCDVPIARGSTRPLLEPLATGLFWNGPGGVGGAKLPPSQCHANPAFGPDLIIETIHKYPHLVTLVPIGPLTNIALAIGKDPSIVPLVKEVILMGGGITGGNVNAVSEYNVHSDPEAAAMVFNAGWPITMVGLDTDEDVAKLEQHPGPETQFAATVLRYQIETYKGTGIFHGGAIHDALAVGGAIDNTFMTTQDMRVDIETQGKFTRGMTVANRKNVVEKEAVSGDHVESVGVEPVTPNVHVATGIDARRFVDFLLSRIGNH
jgi:purine nucleosidase